MPVKTAQQTLFGPFMYKTALRCVQIESKCIPLQDKHGLVSSVENETWNRLCYSVASMPAYLEIVPFLEHRDCQNLMFQDKASIF